jgi:GDP-L-fucose synthase
MQHYDGAGPINVGSGEDLEIQDLAVLIQKITGFSGVIRNDLTKPDGTPQKLLDISKITKMGWRPSTSLEFGIRRVYNEYLCAAVNSEAVKVS